jgi:hypothetical protein
VASRDIDLSKCQVNGSFETFWEVGATVVGGGRPGFGGVGT